MLAAASETAQSSGVVTSGDVALLRFAAAAELIEVPKLPNCAVIRPTSPQGIAVGVANFLTDMGLFIVQPPVFFKALTVLANQADAAQRGV